MPNQFDASTSLSASFGSEKSLAPTLEHVRGELVIKAPWIGITRGLWKDAQRCLDTYWLC